MKNTIILTSGLSGSSVITNLLSRAGFWSGYSTCKKSDYNTHENYRLVELNIQLLKYVDYDRRYSQIVKPEKLLQVAELINKVDLIPFKQFIAECNLETPWIWKDPRLWVTMPFWIQLLDTSDFQLMYIDRSISQRWMSELLRKNIQSFNYCRDYNFQIETIIKQLRDNHELPCCEILFDDLVERPEQTLVTINDFLGCSLDMNDLLAVYNKPLYKKPHGKKSLMLAVLIYLKNYRTRLS